MRRGRKKSIFTYNSKETVLDGIKFASIGEAKRFSDLKLLQHAGEIKELAPHPSFDLIINDIKIGKYTSDYYYIRTKDDQEIVEEYKGFKTPVYNLRVKVFQALYPQYLFIETMADRGKRIHYTKR